MKDVLTLPTPDGALTALWKKVPGHIRLTFFSALICGLAAHLYMFTNKLPNHDDLGHLFEMDYGTASGRWLLPLATRLDGTFSMPWLLGLLSLLFLAVAACLAVSTLHIRHNAGCILTGALMAVFPTTAATFSYMFTADAYFLSTALAAFGAFAAVRWKWGGSILGILAITCSMGIYQSYFGVAAALMVGSLIFETLDGKKSFKALMLRGIRLVAVLGLSVVAYMVMVKITTRNMELVDYMGISDMGKLSLSELPQLIHNSYQSCLDFFLHNDMGFHFGVLQYLFLLTGLSCAGLLVLILLRRKPSPLHIVLAMVLVVLYPLAANIIHVMVPIGTHTLMRYGLVLLPLLTLALEDYACSLEPSPRTGRRTIAVLLSWVIVFTAAVSAYSYIITDNKAYFKMDVAYHQAVAYSNRLVSAIEQTEGYDTGMPIALVGLVDENATENTAPALGEVNMVGVLDLAGYRSSYTYGYLLRYILGFPGSIYTEGWPQVTDLHNDPTVTEMPVYPAAGSIQVVDHMMVVKLGK